MDAVALLQKLLQVRSVNPPGDEEGVTQLLEAELGGAGFETHTLVSPGGRSSFVARLEGPRGRPPLVLLSHSDVVPVEEDSWSRDPFGGDVADGCVWGRGALDMKSMTVMHAHAALQLAASGDTTREVIVVVAADEEAGGREGAAWLVAEHPDLVGLHSGEPAPEVLCEGAYGLSDVLPRPVVGIALGEKSAVRFDVVARGEPGHGAFPPEDQAIVAIARAVEAIAGFGTPRVHDVIKEQSTTLASAAPPLEARVMRALASRVDAVVVRAIVSKMRKRGPIGFLLSDSITPTRIHGGYTSNVVPGEATASFDCRLLPDTEVDGFIRSVDEVARRHGAKVQNVSKAGDGPVSGKGPLFHILERASRDVAPDALPTVTLCPGITDGRFFRARGAAAYGWCPLVLTPELLGTIHGHDERIPIVDLERAVELTDTVVREAAAAS